MEPGWSIRSQRFAGILEEQSGMDENEDRTRDPAQDAGGQAKAAAFWEGRKDGQGEWKDWEVN